jgi:anti-sigma factor RsiW
MREGLHFTRPKVCDRARTYVSLRLDGELSDFEQALLEAHLESCASCRVFATEMSEITAELRVSQLERLERPLILPHRVRAGLRRLQVGAAAAVLVTVVGVGALVGSVRGPDQPRFSTLNSETAQPSLRELRAQDLRVAAKVAPPSGVKILPA